MLFFYISAGVAVFVTMTVAFSIGFSFGYKVSKGIQPKLEPLKPIQEAIAKKEEKEKNQAYDNHLKNLFGYEGEK